MLEPFPAFVLFLHGLISLYHNFENISDFVNTNNEKVFCRSSNDVIGTCLSPSECHVNGYTENSECSTYKICCPIVSSRHTFDAPDIDIENNLLPIDCGVPLSWIEHRITRGVEANLFEFPWQVALKYAKDDKRPFLCGGTLISNRYVLTAAHCIKTATPLTALRFGEYNFDSNPDCIKDGEVEICSPQYLEIPISVEDTIVHEKYSVKTMLNDIALIKLPHPIEFNNHIAPICLPVGYYAKEEFGELTVTGWGYTEHNNLSQILLKVNVPYVTNSQCQGIFQKIVDITDQQLCAGGTDGKDSCGGDSGGPIMFSVGEREYQRWIQAGLVSYGAKDCGASGIPAVYTRLTSYIDWILINMELHLN